MSRLLETEDRLMKKIIELSTEECGENVKWKILTQHSFEKTRRQSRGGRPSL